MKLYSYVVARDYGFAPNPFYGVCTLATCKPEIRQHAQVGDWIIGTGSKRYGLAGRLVFAMRVAETPTFEEYWVDNRFLLKRPFLRGSFKQAFGDNIYHRDPQTEKWLQENSHHSLLTGKANWSNVKHDTHANRVLVGTEFTYWGASAPSIPVRFRRQQIYDVCAHRGHKCIFPQQFVDSFVSWYKSLLVTGYAGQPKEFPE
jgi:hypothetical protein